MIDIVIDTNVLLSALYSNRGASHKLLSMIDSKKFRVNISTTLLYEYEEIIKSKSELTDQEADVVLDYICQIGVEQKLFYLWRPMLKDPDDDFLLELTVKSRAVIVTLNAKDFNVAHEFGIKVVTPKELLKMIGAIE
jgi:putative PIN family toxin of toxin-antitoxin system